MECAFLTAQDMSFPNGPGQKSPFCLQFSRVLEDDGSVVRPCQLCVEAVVPSDSRPLDCRDITPGQLAVITRAPRLPFNLMRLT